MLVPAGVVLVAVLAAADGGSAGGDSVAGCAGWSGTRYCRERSGYRLEVSYDARRRISTQFSFYPNGQLREERSFVAETADALDGAATGASRGFLPDGGPEYDNSSGHFRQWFATGQLATETTERGSSRVTRSWYENGKPQEEHKTITAIVGSEPAEEGGVSPVYADRLEGRRRRWADNGRLIEDRVYLHGAPRATCPAPFEARAKRVRSLSAFPGDGLCSRQCDSGIIAYCVDGQGRHQGVLRGWSDGNDYNYYEEIPALVLEAQYSDGVLRSRRVLSPRLLP